MQANTLSAGWASGDTTVTEEQVDRLLIGNRVGAFQ